jgi:hypothetical protein
LAYRERTVCEIESATGVDGDTGSAQRAAVKVVDAGTSRCVGNDQRVADGIASTTRGEAAGPGGTKSILSINIGQGERGNREIQLKFVGNSRRHFEIVNERLVWKRNPVLLSGDIQNSARSQ